jgi:hypothetical protein
VGEIVGQGVLSRVPDAVAYKLTGSEVEALRETLGKCVNPVTGEPVSARREEFAVLPVASSVTGSADGNGRGSCPFCGAHVRLSGKGFVTSHTTRQMPIAAPSAAVRLAERQTVVAESGVRVGSPDAAERSRSAELVGAAFKGWHPPLVLPGHTVRITVREPKLDADGRPVLGKRGRPLTESRQVDVPATEANVRTALRQEQGKKRRPVYRTDESGRKVPTGEMRGGPDAGVLARLGSILKGLHGAAAVPVLGAAPGTYRVREAAVVDRDTVDTLGERGNQRDVRPRVAGARDGRVPSSVGPAMVQGRAMEPVVPERENRHGKPLNAAGWSDPLGRPRLDAMVVAGGNPEACGGVGCTVEGCVAVVGAHRGVDPREVKARTCAEFRVMTRTQQRRYKAWVAKREAAVREARARKRAGASAHMGGRVRTADGGQRVTPSQGHITGKAMGAVGSVRVV